MAKTATLNIRIDPEIKKRSEQLFSGFGITVSDAVNMFLHQSLFVGGLPFELRAPNKETMEALEDARSRKNLSGPYDSMEGLMEALNS